MALSNWDHAAWDKFGDPREGTLTFPRDIILEIYKDWLYIHDPNVKGSYFTVDNKHVSVYSDHREKTILEVNEGKVYYKGIDVTVFRNEQHGTFIHAIYDGSYTEDGDCLECIPIIFCGIGKYGFTDHEWTGITESDVIAFTNWLKKIKSPLNNPIGDAKPYNQGDAFFCGADKAMNRYGAAHNTVLGYMLKHASDK
jgi:hypothetical protein